MKVYDAASIRNVALVGHSGSGKTQLASAMLADAGMVNRFGKVDEGTTVTDYDEEEIARKHTLSASLAYAEWNKQKINLIDTPGVGNFLSDARAALNVADAALVVVDAVAGVMVQTEKVWAAAEERALPRLVVAQPPRSRARQPRAHAGVAARVVQPRGDPDPAADRRGAATSAASSIWCRGRRIVFKSDGSGTFTEGAGARRDEPPRSTPRARR